MIFKFFEIFLSNFYSFCSLIIKPVLLVIFIIISFIGATLFIAHEILFRRIISYLKIEQFLMQFLCMFCLILLVFLVQYINWSSEIPASISPFWEIISKELVGIWSDREEVEHINRLLFNSLSESVWQMFLYLFTKTNKICKFIWLIFFENEFSLLKQIDIKVPEHINFISFSTNLREIVSKCI